MPSPKGGHHFSDGATWVEQLARPVGLAGNTRPAFQGAGTEATNYAVGGARAHEDRINFNLSFQVQTFLNTFGDVAPADALYVVEFGSNDIREALTAFAAGKDGVAILMDALSSIATNFGVLYTAGARKFMVCNAPDFSLTPGVGNLARLLSVSYNSGIFD